MVENGFSREQLPILGLTCTRRVVDHVNPLYLIHYTGNQPLEQPQIRLIEHDDRPYTAYGRVSCNVGDVLWLEHIRRAP
ncbi:hypothetical protein D3C79_1068850 [compost metagenome]